MAGGDYHSVKIDPAVERWQDMHSTMYERFRMTPSATRKILFWGALIPFLTYKAAVYSDNRWDLRSKTRQDSLLRQAPASAAASSAEEEEE